MVGLLRVKRFTLTSWAVAEYLPAANPWKKFLDFVVARITRMLPPWLLLTSLWWLGSCRI